MLVQVALQGERLVAAWTLEMLEARMRLHMCPQIGAVSEGLSTVSATEWLFASVGSHVALQKPGSRKGLPADLASVLQVVRQDVHCQRGH